MTDPEHVCGSMDHPLPTMTPEELYTILELLGIQACREHAPEDPRAVTAGLLAGLLATTQAHIQTYPDQAELFGEVYHQMRHNLGFPCRRPHP